MHTCLKQRSYALISAQPKTLRVSERFWRNSSMLALPAAFRESE